MRKGTRKREKKFVTGSKFGNKKVVIDGIQFDSKAESEYYCYIRGLPGWDLELKPTYTLQEGYISPRGEKIRPILYEADFVVIHPDGTRDVVDVKGSRAFMTDLFKIKRKLFEYKFKQPLYVVYKGKNGEWIYD